MYFDLRISRPSLPYPVWVSTAPRQPHAATESACRTQISEMPGLTKIHRMKKKTVDSIKPLSSDFRKYFFLLDLIRLQRWRRFFDFFVSLFRSFAVKPKQTEKIIIRRLTSFLFSLSRSFSLGGRAHRFGNIRFKSAESRSLRITQIIIKNV